MLDTFRSSKSNTFVWIVIVLLIIALAGFGINSAGGGASRTAIANVGEHEVYVREYATAYRQQQQALARQFGRALSPEEMAIFGFDAQVMDNLLTAAAIDGEADRIGLSIGDEEVKDALLATPAFQNPAGGFDTFAYETLLRQAGYSPGDYDEVIRDETVRGAIQSIVVAGISPPTTGADAVAAFSGQRRTLDWTRLTGTVLGGEIPAPTEDDLTAFHETNAADYTLPEVRKITYAYLTEALLGDQIEIDEADVRALYEDRVDEYQSPDQRLLDRLGFADMAAAEAALARINEAGASFDDIAEERGLGPTDIDMGTVQAEDLGADARALVFGTENLGVVGPVATDLGPTLFRINAVFAARETPFEDVRDELAAELSQEEAAAEIGEQVEAFEDLIAGGATIEELAAETPLVLATLDFTPEADNDLVRDADFREEVLAAEVGQDRDLISLSDGVAVVRVDEIIPPTLQPLADIRDAVIADWTASETANRIEALAETFREEIDGGKALTDIAAERDFIITAETPLGRNDIIEDTPPAFLDTLFETDPGKAYIVRDGDTILLGQVGEIVPLDPESDDAARLQRIAVTYQGSTTQDVFTYFARGLQAEAGVSIEAGVLRQVQEQLGAQQ